ncbi:MAG: metal ABC transporter substrate-binding protein, partial [Chloroflexi bacterium]|nr:metal ABC transporter substrate-binding protein [Chloroflexota bacterium]
MRFRIALAALFGVLVLAAACGDSDTSSERTAAVATPTPSATEAAESGDPSTARLTVIATIYPLGYFAERVGGDRAEVNVLVGPGVEAHGYEVTASELRTLGDADVIVMNGIGLEPWIERAIHAVEDDISAIVVEAADSALAMEGEVHMHDDE